MYFVRLLHACRSTTAQIHSLLRHRVVVPSPAAAEKIAELFLLKWRLKCGKHSGDCGASMPAVHFWCGMIQKRKDKKFSAFLAIISGKICLPVFDSGKYRYPLPKKDGIPVCATTLLCSNHQSRNHPCPLQGFPSHRRRTVNLRVPAAPSCACLLIFLPHPQHSPRSNVYLLTFCDTRIFVNSLPTEVVENYASKFCCHQPL